MNAEDRTREITDPLIAQFPRRAIYFSGLESLEFVVGFMRQHAKPAPDWSKTALYDAWRTLAQWYDHYSDVGRPATAPPRHAWFDEVLCAATYLGFEIRNGKRGMEARMVLDFDPEKWEAMAGIEGYEPRLRLVWPRPQPQLGGA